MDTPVYVNSGFAERAPRPALTFPAILTDPLVRLVMKADGVDPAELEQSLADIAATLSPQPERDAARCPAFC